jgi:hypothetical protein
MRLTSRTIKNRKCNMRSLALGLPLVREMGDGLGEGGEEERDDGGGGVQGMGRQWKRCLTIEVRILGF